MRIFFVTNNYTPYSGGVTNSIIATTNALRAQGHEVFIVTLDFLGTHSHSDPDYVIRLTCPIKFMYKKNHLAVPWRPTHTLTQLLKQYNPDIVHVHHPFLLGVSAVRAARICNIPCVFTYHTLYEQYAHYVPLPALCAKPLIRTTVASFCNSINGIIAPSSTVKEYLHSQQITSPITIIPSPLRPLFFTPVQSLHPCARPELVEGFPRAQKNETNKHFELLVVSRFVPEKNIPFVFDVFKQLPEMFTLTLVGYGTDYEYLQQLAFNTLCLPPQRVRFIHKPNIDDLLHIYRNADVCIFSSTSDTQGLVLAESMSQGLPVIAVDGPGQRDIIINDYNGFIIENANHAATTVMKIANSPSLHNQLRSGARATAQHYHTDTITQQLLDFYHMTIS